MASNPALNAISANGANLSNSASDLSVSTMTNIFGDKWWNLIDAAQGGSAGNAQFIYSLLETLNSCCAIVVAWLMIFTVLIASVGSAQEGRSIGGQYASAWVPLRFSFSFAAITPVFNGLCALQILILACIGVSIDLANTMYNKGIDWILEQKTVSASIPPKIGTVAQKLVSGAVKSQVLIQYLTTQAQCEGLSATTLVEQIDTTGDTLLLFNVPNNGLLTCNGYKVRVHPSNAFGGFRISNENKELAVIRIAAIKEMVNKTEPLAQSLANLKPDYQKYSEILNAGKIYADKIYEAAKKDLVKKNENNIKEANESFKSVAKNQGWFTLGSYYWTLANSVQSAMDAMKDTSSYVNTNLDVKQKNLAYDSWKLSVEHTLNELEKMADNPIDVGKEKSYNSSSAVSSSDGLGSMGKYFNDFLWIFAVDDNYASKTAGLIGGPDAIISTIQLARKVTGICVGGILAAEAAKLAGVAVGDSLLKWIGGSAARQAAVDLFWLVFFGLGSIWVFATFVAYIVPAMPFLIWLAAIVGWVVLCLEAVIAAPLWLIGHAMPEGAGFAGQHGRTGYMLILSILVRPLLLVISMFLAMIIMQATGSLIEPLFVPFTYSMNTFSGWGSGLGITGNIFLFFILTGTIVLFTWKIFELVTQIPDRLIRWVGQNIQNLGDEGRTAMANNVIGSTKAQSQKMGNLAGGISGIKSINRPSGKGGDSKSSGDGDNPGGGSKTTDRLSQGNVKEKPIMKS